TAAGGAAAQQAADLAAARARADDLSAAVARQAAEIEHLRASTRPAPAYPLKSRVGVNTNGAPLADLIKSRSGFGPLGQPWKSDPALQPKKDADGWPLEDASIQLVWNQHGFTGDYVLTFKGKATVDGFWNVDVTGLTHDSATNRSRANVRLRPKGASTGDLAESYLNFRNTSGGVRDVVLVRKEHEGHYLNPDWVKLHAPFGVLRSMDLQKTNVSTWVTSWATRPRVEQACYGATGYPLEVLVDIANATGSAPYVCLPIWADDDYCRRAFELVKARLDPKLPAYVESGNENWNGGVPPVKDYWIKACTTNGVFDGNLYNSGRLPMLQASRRAAIGLEVFKDQPGRLRNVLGAQVANHWRDGGAIKWLDAETKTKLRDRFYAVGLAIYAPAKTDRAAMLPLGTAEEVAAYLMRRVEEPFKANVTEWVRTTDAEGVRRLLYECGTEWPEGGEQRAARAASQGLPAAGEFVTRFLARMAGEVGAEEMLWNSSVDDWSGGKPYGLTYDPRRLDGPKYRAAVDAAALYRPTN
ncbi:MAG TPA: hypothetical protein VK324_13845, partial [Tepidisphaeraceae bacterium]|nr:hypothetical protein [Tepidisphaeraceae bacterium]